jgi:hypothetical protein
MRQSQSTVSAAAVHAYAQELLRVELELADFKQAVPAPLLASVLILAACWQTSLSAVCSLVRGLPSHETVRKALFAALPARPSDLRQRLHALLARTLPEHLRNRPVPFALDVHRRPFYGRPTRASTRGRKKAGTRGAFAYATLAALAPEGAFTVAFLLVRRSMRLTTVVTRLLARADELQLCCAYLLMDKEFYAAEVIDLLQRRDQAFVVPAPRRGRRPGAGTAHLFDPARTPLGWHSHTWTAKRRRGGLPWTVTVAMCVARHWSSGRRLVFATDGLGAAWAPAEVAAAYRKRFGIEVQYRQLGQCLARTSSRDERVRLLLVGLALTLCNVWAQLHSEAFAAGPLPDRQRRLGVLRLRVLTLALAAAVVGMLGGIVDQWPTLRPLPPEFTTPQDP